MTIAIKVVAAIAAVVCGSMVGKWIFDKSEKDENERNRTV
jgi:hypothetical protein